ncbi:hypothetical protein IV417_11850 [Alphaproteobacteria bacterium KMM 3653]|uniref:Sulfotransferase family protein n=1 Tax=Harenicola maris TaxID=2841044 RepID=A0AAP2CRA0_9RHOB|nr:hypothetical protein [Harenicola maris]
MPLLGKPRIAVVGAFRSGTNYVQYLLEQNYRCRVTPDAHGWKHLPVPVRRRAANRWIDGRVPLIGVIRSPLGFLTSLYRYRVEIGRNIDAPTEWEAFLFSRFAIHHRHPQRTACLSFANPLEYWNSLYINLLTLPQPAFRSRIVVYDAITADPQAEIEKLADWAGLRRCSADFHLPGGHLSRGSGRMRRLLTGCGAAMEATPREKPKPFPLPSFTQEQLAFIKGHAAPELTALLGPHCPELRQ